MTKCGAIVVNSGPDATLWRWTINLDTGTVEESRLDDRGVEFPRIDDRVSGRSARYSVAVGNGALIRYDLHRDTAVEHRFAARQADPVRPVRRYSRPRSVSRTSSRVGI